MVVTHPFYLAETELTRRQWLNVMGSDPTSWETSALDLRAEDVMEIPVSDISYDMLQEFLKATGLDLPRDSEWEYACKAGTGDLLYGYDEVADIAWYGENSTHPMPVGLLGPNPWGFYDMIGNNWEFTRTSRDDFRKFSKPERMPVESDDEIQTFHVVLRGAGGGLPASEMRATKRGGRERDQPRPYYTARVSYHPAEHNPVSPSTEEEAKNR
jgi:formylglycine-generating enzyme required for sulfatase activity